MSCLRMRIHTYLAQQPHWIHHWDPGTTAALNFAPRRATAASCCIGCHHCCQPLFPDAISMLLLCQPLCSFPVDTRLHQLLSLLLVLTKIFNQFGESVQLRLQTSSFTNLLAQSAPQMSSFPHICSTFYC